MGSYWPYLSTVWDYVNRSMPFGNAQSLSPDEVYAITAYILYSNFLVEDDFTLSHENFTEVEMPNADGFIVDDRAETEYAIWHGEPCMENCKDSVEITMRAAVLDVTPDEEGPRPKPRPGRRQSRSRWLPPRTARNPHRRRTRSLSPPVKRCFASARLAIRWARVPRIAWARSSTV